MMQRFPWDPALETGNETIDAQHRKLFELAERLHQACAEHFGCDDAAIDAVYELSEYCVQHLHDEELLMMESGYPGRALHMALHEHLTARTIQLMARFLNGEDRMPDGVAPFMVDWLTTHIAQADRRFVEYLDAQRR